MFESILEKVISIDIDGEAIHFYSVDKRNQKNIYHDAHAYRARPFSEEFFEKLGYVLNLHREQKTGEQPQKVSLILPDQMFLMDTINIPTINKGAMQSSLGVAVANIYKNADALEYKTFITAQNRQFTTYGLVGIRKSLIDDLKSLCSSYQIGVSNITFSANAAANAAFVLNPKLKNTSFILLDIKERSARFSIIIKGRTMGYYSLPFGYSILSKTHLTAEDLLFDHAAAELLILNAKEKAKAKHLTVSEDTENIGSPDLSDDESAGDGENTLETEDEDFEIKYSAESNKRSARKLPKFMLRDVPTTSEACVYENFRIFMKWTIDLYNNNASLINLGGADTVYVNMPDENTFLYPMINAEVAENKLKFMPLIESTDQDSYAKDLELFGGLYVKQYNKVNNF